MGKKMVISVWEKKIGDFCMAKKEIGDNGGSRINNDVNDSGRQYYDKSKNE